MDHFLYNLFLILQKAGQSLLSFIPYIISGIVLGELLKLTSWTKIIYRFVSRSPVKSITAASVIGIVSPLCTYGTVPLTIQLYRAGVPLPPLVAFLSASTMMNPQLFIYVSGGLGLNMALMQTAAVFIFALLTGFVLLRIPQRWVVNRSLNVVPDTEFCATRQSWKSFHWKAFLKSLWENLEYIGFYLIIGALLGAAVEVFVPGSWISSVAGHGKWTSVLFATILGIPLYVCGGGMVPLIKTFMQQGMSQGAALSFFLIGPATRINSLAALAGMLRPTFIASYVAALFCFSYLLGVII